MSDAPRPRPRRRTAAALRYDAAADNAPRVLASGQGAHADQIVEVAKQHHIPIHADPQLAELLAALDVGACIPDELYLIVAEILIFVHEVDRGYEGASAAPVEAAAPPHAIREAATARPEAAPADVTAGTTGTASRRSPKE